MSAPQNESKDTIDYSIPEVPISMDILEKMNLQKKRDKSLFRIISFEKFIEVVLNDNKQSRNNKIDESTKIESKSKQLPKLSSQPTREEIEETIKILVERRLIKSEDKIKNSVVSFIENNYNIKKKEKKNDKNEGIEKDINLPEVIKLQYSNVLKAYLCKIMDLMSESYSKFTNPSSGDKHSRALEFLRLKSYYSEMYERLKAHHLSLKTAGVVDVIDELFRRTFLWKKIDKSGAMGSIRNAFSHYSCVDSAETFRLMDKRIFLEYHTTYEYNKLLEKWPPEKIILYNYYENQLRSFTETNFRDLCKYFMSFANVAISLMSKSDIDFHTTFSLDIYMEFFKIYDLSSVRVSLITFIEHKKEISDRSPSKPPSSPKSPTKETSTKKKMDYGDTN